MIHQKCHEDSLEAEEEVRVVGKGGKQSSSRERRALDSPGRRNLPLIIISTPFPPIDSNLEKHLEDGWLELVIHRGRVRQREAGNKNFRRWLIIN